MKLYSLLVAVETCELIQGLNKDFFAQVLICAGTGGWYGVAALVLKVVPGAPYRQRCCHNGSMLCICKILNVTKISNCNSPEAFIRTKCTIGQLTMLPDPLVSWGGSQRLD